MSKKESPKSSYVPIDIAASVNEHENGVRGGQPCWVDHLSKTFAWMPGSINAWLGWPNHGKGVFTDYMYMLDLKYAGHKIAMFKPEDMNTEIIAGKPEIRANRIYKNLAWTLTGKTWNKNFAERWNVKQMSIDEELDILDFIQKNVFVIYPEDRRYKSMEDEFLRMYELFGVFHFMWDPWNEVEVEDGKTMDRVLSQHFSSLKKMTMRTGGCTSVVSHPRSLNEVHDKDGAFKVVNQFMQLGGSAWNTKFDMIISQHRPFVHKDPNSPDVQLYTFKVRDSDTVGVKKGHVEDIKFDFKRRQYYFDGLNPMDGSVADWKLKKMMEDIGVDPNQTQQTFGKNFMDKKDKKTKVEPKTETVPPPSVDDCPF